MIVNVQLFAAAKDAAGTDTVALNVAEGATIETLRALLADNWPALAPILGFALFAVDGKYADDRTPLSAGGEIALIPPVSGG